MGTIVTTMVQTVEHYFMQFNTKTLGENRKSPIQVITCPFISFLLISIVNNCAINKISHTWL